jgi:phosphoribosylamine---glycine ligase
MKVCVVGSGGREHALALSLARTAEVIVTPGNPGMAGHVSATHLATDLPGHLAGDEYRRISVSADPPEAIDAELFVIGPEAPLVDGLADRLRADRRLVFGPGADGARLEGSKAFMKDLLAEAGVPTARYGVFDDLDAARAFLRQLPGPWVVKTDGLAAGKGVLVTDSLAEAEADVESKLSGARFGDAGRRVVVEEGLEGPECSLLVLCDGRRIAALAPAQDYKRLRDGGDGPNTGGMGAYSPVPVADDRLVDRVLDQAVEPLVGALRSRGIDYRGVLYAGLILTSDGPRVLEYNVRFGDPETQVVLPRLTEDLTALLAEAAAGRLRTEPRFAPDAAVCVVVAAEGYPDGPRTGDRIEGLEDAAQLQGVTVLHAGTARDDAGHICSAGGRVLGVCAVGENVDRARVRAYDALQRINLPGMQYRSDIAAVPATAAATASATAATSSVRRSS